MWLLKYNINEVTINHISNDEKSRESVKNSLLNDPAFIEAYVFGKDANNKITSLYISKKQTDFRNMNDPDKDKKQMYIDECMNVSERFLKNNKIFKKYVLRVRNYYDFNKEDGYIYIDRSSLIDMEVR